MHLRFLLALAFVGTAPCVGSAQPAALPAQDSLTITLRITDARAQPLQRSDAHTPVPPQVQALTPAPPAEAAATLVTVTY